MKDYSVSVGSSKIKKSYIDTNSKLDDFDRETIRKKCKNCPLILDPEDTDGVCKYCRMLVGCYED